MHPFLIWVEGDSDRRFFERIVSPLIAPHFEHVRVKEFSHLEKTVFNRRVSQYRLAGIHYLVAGDQDNAICAAERKQKLCQIHPAIEPERIVVVGREIEAWYVAGLSAERESKLGLRAIPKLTDDFTKEHFEAVRPRRFSSSVNFMEAILKHFDTDIACQRNRSFAHLARRIATIGDLK